MEKTFKVKFNIGDKVKILKDKPNDALTRKLAQNNNYFGTEEINKRVLEKLNYGIISGYVVHYTTKNCRVYYLVEGHEVTNHKARYNVNDLELVKEN